MKKISSESFEILKISGHVVPRNKNKYIIPFVVGKEYIVQNEETKETLKVRCTQDCPHHLRLINNL